MKWFVRSDILGYTEEELLSFFSDCITRLAEETGAARTGLIRKIRRWYDGYRFTALDKRVYNPFSVLKLFESGEFENFWFETETPGFLLSLIRTRCSTAVTSVTSVLTASALPPEARIPEATSAISGLLRMPVRRAGFGNPGIASEGRFQICCLTLNP